MAQPNCSLDDIDLSALKVSEFVQARSGAGPRKSSTKFNGKLLNTINGAVKSF